MILSPESVYTPKPQMGLTVNWSHALAQNLMFYVPMLEGTDTAGTTVGTRDLVYGTPGNPKGASKPTWDKPGGKRYKFTSGGAFESSCVSFLAAAIPLAQLDPFLGTVPHASFMVRFVWSGVANCGLLGQSGADGSGVGWGIGINSSILRFKVPGTSTDGRWNPAIGPTTGVPTTLVVTYDNARKTLATAVKMWINGRPTNVVLQFAGGVAGSQTTASAQNLNIGDARTDSMNAFADYIECAAIWKGRLLGEAEVAQLTSNPYCMLRTGSRLFAIGLVPLTNTLADSFTVSDTLVLTKGLNYSFDDSNSFSDSFAMGMNQFLSFNDAIAAFNDGLIVSRDGDVPIQLTDLFSISDLFQLLGPIALEFNDQFTLSEVFNALGHGDLTFTEVLTIIDTLGLAIPIKILYGSPNTSFGIQGFVDDYYFIGPADNIVLADNLLARLAAALGLTDTLALLDAIQTRLVVSDPQFSDTFAMSDQVAVKLVGVKTATLSDTLVLSDSLSISIGSSIIPYIRRYLNDVQ